MGLTTAERNRKKRERKKREKEERRKEEEAAASAKKVAGESGADDANEDNETNPATSTTNHNNESDEEDEVEIEYVAKPILSLAGLSSSATTADDETENESRTKASNSSGGLPDGLPPGLVQDQQATGGTDNENDDSNNNDMESILRRFHQRASVAAVIVSDEERGGGDGVGKDRRHKKRNQGSDDDDDSDNENDSDNDEYDDDDEEKKPMSKRKWREMTRPTVADLKRRVRRPDLVEAHDITAADPDFLIHLKGVHGTVSVPRHWGRKRKYLQGKRGFEKPPFQLPEFIVKTGITEIRDTVAEDEASQSAKQRNRGRVAPKMGVMDVDYKTLHDAFFKHQTKPTDLTKFGDLYYEGKELETNASDRKPGGPLSQALKEALGMSLAEPCTSPPPWLINMQRYGPPPSYPNLPIPGLNAPLPKDQCQYGYHVGGWGKPPVDGYGRPLYGGNPFDPPGSGTQDSVPSSGLVTSDGKTIKKDSWGGLPTADFMIGGHDDDESSSEEEDESSASGDEDAMDESDSEDVVVVGSAEDGIESVLPPPPHSLAATAPGDLRKTAGDETPLAPPPKQLYQVLEQTKGSAAKGAVFGSEVQYVLPGTGGPETAASDVPEGAESVLSKAIAPSDTAKRKRREHGEDDEEDLGKNFKF